MLELRYVKATKDDVNDIKSLSEALGCPYDDYQTWHDLAEADHKPEVPMLVIAHIGDRLQKAKNVHYKNSWSKRGIFSCFFNMERKWERFVESVFGGTTVMDTASEAFMDTILDLAVYSMKLVGWVAARRPDLYRKMLRSVALEVQSVGQLEKGWKVAPETPNNDHGIQDH